MGFYRDLAFLNGGKDTNPGTKHIIFISKLVCKSSQCVALGQKHRPFLNLPSANL
jgi:hypothetical protein